MQPTPALIVLAAQVDDSLHRSLAAAAVRALDRRHPVRVLDLVVDGFVPAMTADERRAYHTDQPILDPQVRLHADLVMAAGVLVFVYPTAWWSPPPALKAWLERVIVPGVGFVFDARNHVRPNLGSLRAIAGITTYEHPNTLRKGGDGGRAMLHRALGLNVPHRVRRVWVAGPIATGRSLEPQVRRELGRL